MKRIIESPRAPAAIGPYSQVIELYFYSLHVFDVIVMEFLWVKAVRAGNTVYVSGCIGLVPETRQLIEGGIEAQTRQVLENLKNIVEESGSTLSNVVKCTVLLTNMADFATVNSIYAEYFPEEPPARMTYAVAGLPANALVEIDAIAIVP